MRKLHIFALAVATVYAFGAISATSAFAATELLSNGEKITSDLLVEITGEGIWHDLSNGLEALCSGIAVALIEAGGKTGTVNEFLTLAKTLVAESGLNRSLTTASGDAIECTSIKVCESGHPTLMVAINLPWSGSINASGNLEVGAESEEYVTCFVLGILFENVCFGLGEGTLENDPITGDVRGTSIGPELSCDNGDTFIGASDAPETVSDIEGSLLTVN